MTSESTVRIAGAVTGLTIGVVSLSVAYYGLFNLSPFFFIPVWLTISGLLHDYVIESTFLSRVPAPLNSCIFWAASFPIYKAIFDIASVNIFSYNITQFLSVLLWWVIAGFMFGIPFFMLSNYASKLINIIMRMKRR